MYKVNLFAVNDTFGISEISERKAFMKRRKWNTLQKQTPIVALLFISYVHVKKHRVGILKFDEIMSSIYYNL